MVMSGDYRVISFTYCYWDPSTQMVSVSVPQTSASIQM